MGDDPQPGVHTASHVLTILLLLLLYYTRARYFSSRHEKDIRYKVDRA